MNNSTFRRMMERMENTFQELEDTFRDFERGFDDQFGDSIRGRLAGFPVDVEETDDQIIVRADLPGVEKDRINVNVAKNTVNVRAQDERELKEEGKDYVRQERRAQNYHRNITLPVAVDPDSAEATYENGVLTVTLTKESAGNGTGVEIK